MVVSPCLLHLCSCLFCHCSIPDTFFVSSPSLFLSFFLSGSNDPEHPSPLVKRNRSYKPFPYRLPHYKLESNFLPFLVRYVSRSYKVRLCLVVHVYSPPYLPPTTHPRSLVLLPSVLSPTPPPVRVWWVPGPLIGLGCSLRNSVKSQVHLLPGV